MKKRFLSKIKKTNNCWLWIGSKSHGYGYFYLNYKKIRAHRLSWEIHRGKIPNILCVLHTCDNRLCVNPKHLWLGTKSDNNKDRTSKGRSAFGGENGRSKLTEKQIKIIRRIYKKGRTSTNTFRLSEKFGVTNSVISDIINYKIWKNV